MTNEEFVSSLRQLADWYEQHPTVPIPHDFSGPMLTFLPGWNSEDGEQVRKGLRGIGDFVKSFEDDEFSALKQIGSITLRFPCRRETVCTSRVVGHRLIPGKIIPATPEQVVPDKLEDIVEWDCKPIIQGRNEEDSLKERVERADENEVPF